MDAAIESILFIAREVYVYQVRPRLSRSSRCTLSVVVVAGVPRSARLALSPSLR